MQYLYQDEIKEVKSDKISSELSQESKCQKVNQQVSQRLDKRPVEKARNEKPVKITVPKKRRTPLKLIFNQCLLTRKLIMKRNKILI